MSIVTPDEILYLIEKSRNLPMTDEQLSEQRRSFAYGNTAIENPRITREMVEAEAQRMGL